MPEPEPVRSGELWRSAAALIERDAGGLRSAVPAAARGGFRGGAEWMRRASILMRSLGGDPKLPRGRAPFTALGLFKYGIALGCGSTAAWGVLAARWLWTDVQAPPGPLAVSAASAALVSVFYLVEAQLVFAFPCALDGAIDPFSASRDLVRRRGTLATLRVLVSLAARMVFGAPWRLVHRWSVGCLAVVLWYEHERRAFAEPADAPSGAPAR